MRVPTMSLSRWAKVPVFLACLAPMVLTLVALYNDQLGANPAEALTRGMGGWSLKFLMITLAVTPVRRLTGWNGIIRYRRMLGLFAAAYALAHLTSYAIFDQSLDPGAILHDIGKRPFITIGMACFALLALLSVTSPHAVARRLGGRRWQALHRAVYLAGGLAVLHYFWLVKADTRLPWRYAALLAVLLGLRVLWRWRRASPSPGRREARGAAIATDARAA